MGIQPEKSVGATGLHPNPEDFSSLETFDKGLAAAIVPEHAQEFDSNTESVMFFARLTYS